MFRLFSKLDVKGLEGLSVSERVNYQSYYMANEILDSISTIIDMDINVKIQKSEFITVLADESTDKANKKRITLNARIADGSTSLPETVFLCDYQYEDGTGSGLSNVILNELERRGIPISKLIGFGSDGASVMTGENKGIKGILMNKAPHLVHIHCMAHRLALCTSQAADAIPGLKKYQEWLTSLFYYFDESSSREAELHRVQEVLDSPVLKYKEIHAVRWLSVYNAVESVYRTLDPLISYFHQRQAAKDPKSKGLLKKLATRDFLYITYMLMDVLAIVSKLCLVFQEMNLDIASAKVALDTCVSDLESYKKNTQLFPTHLERYEADVEERDGQLFFRQHHISKTNTNLLALKTNFINALIDNILKRFPQKTLVEAFHILGMRTINFCSEENAVEYGNAELDQI